MKYLTAMPIATFAFALFFPPSAADAQQPPKSSLYVIFFKLTPEAGFMEREFTVRKWLAAL